MGVSLTQKTIGAIIYSTLSKMNNFKRNSIKKRNIYSH